MGAPKDIAGQKFNKLTAIKFTGESTTSGRIWECVCDCGNIALVPIGKLTSSHTKSCGCQKIESTIKRSTKHGFAQRGILNKTWMIWTDMRKRCFNKNNNRFNHYGGRGITICERWNDFNNFIEDMGECPDGYSIERVDVNGNYAPENCKWIPMIEQSRNTTRVIYITINGETKILADWARHFSIDYRKVQYRIKKGWDVLSAFTTP